MALSPMMRQYFEIKKQYEDVIVLFRLGDFYEMFFDDAIMASKELELTLTGRDCGLEERAPMCGVPYHAVDSYIQRLIDKGHKVGICEQLTPPGGKEIVKRDVVRVITAGTVTNLSALKEDKNNFLASAYLEGDSVGLSWVDISTGEFNHAMIDPPIAARLNDLLSRIAPAEIICNAEMLEKSLELSVIKFNSVCPFSLYKTEAFLYANAYKNLNARLSKTSLEMLSSKKLCISSAGALVQYLNETQKRELSHIKEVSLDNADEYMILDASARRTLELSENMTDGGRKGTLLSLIDKTATGMGKRMLRKWINEPSLNSDTINKRLNSVEELIGDIKRDKFTAILKNIFDVERLATKLSYDNLMPRDALSLASSLSNFSALKSELAKCNEKLLKSTIETKIIDFSEICKLIISAINPESPNAIKEGRIFNDGFDSKLDEYRNVSNNAVEILAKLERDEREETGIKTLKISYNRVFGYYIEVTKSQLELVPYRYIRKQTVSNGERYITEELKELETQILNSQELSYAREIELYSMLTQEIKKHLDQILSSAKAVAYLDCLVSHAISAKDYNLVKPVINKDINHIKITQGRHPVVERLNKNEPFVPNDTFLDSAENKIMVITGPNMSGKSVYMRQVAVITLLAHIGSFVPAESAEISLTDRIFTRVGASDDLSTGRSTFMVEMTEVAYILDNLTKNSLILLDEIGRGTSTFDGLSIAWSIIEYLSVNSCAKTLFSTHYHEITELEGALSGIKNYKLSIKEFNNSIIFLRKLMRGGANRSFGIEVASLAGLNKEIIVRAKEILTLLESSDIGKRADSLSGRTEINNEAANQNSERNVKFSEIKAILNELDVDSISPRAALDILSDLKDKVR